MTLMIMVGFVMLASIVLTGSATVIFYIRKKHRFLYTRFDRLEREMWNVQVLNNLIHPRAPLPQPGGWAASVDFLAEVVRLIETRRPALVVELGSGLSTVVIALKLADLGSGRLVSIDHEKNFSAATSRLLEAHGVAELVDLRIAPLVTYPQVVPDMLWYDTTVIDDLFDIDLLVIDGPPMPIDPLIRGPALPFFKSRLAEDARIILDDAARDGEQAILKEWRRHFPEIEIHEMPLEKGAAVITNCART